jgi:hypothetical protein
MMLSLHARFQGHTLHEEVNMEKMKFMGRKYTQNSGHCQACAVGSIVATELRELKMNVIADDPLFFLSSEKMGIHLPLLTCDGKVEFNPCIPRHR